MTDASWFAVARKFFDTAPRPFCEGLAWLHLVSLANHAPNASHVPPLMRGQLCTSAGKLARAWGWDRNDTRSALRRWERDGRVLLESVKRATVITVTGYETYQNPAKKWPNDGPTVAQRWPNDGPTGSRADAGSSGHMAQPWPNDGPTVAQPWPTSTEQVTTQQENNPTSEVVRYEVAQARDADPGGGGGQDRNDGVTEPDAPSIEVAEDRVEGVGRTEDGAELYIEFVRYGPGNPASIRALKAASFTFDGMRWTGPQTAANRRLLRAMHPELTRVCNLDDQAKADAERAAPAEPPPSPPPTGEDVAALLDVDCDQWRRVRDRMRRDLGDKDFGELFATFAGEVVDGVLRLVTGDEMAKLIADRPNYRGLWAAAAQAELGVDVEVEVEHSNVVRLEDRRGA